MHMLIYFILGFLEGIFGFFQDSEESVFGTIYQLLVLVPSLAVGVRRMHDIGKSGWILLVPILNLVFALMPGNKEANRFGELPKY